MFTNRFTSWLTIESNNYSQQDTQQTTGTDHTLILLTPQTHLHSLCQTKRYFRPITGGKISTDSMPHGCVDIRLLNIWVMEDNIWINKADLIIRHFVWLYILATAVKGKVLYNIGMAWYRYNLIISFLKLYSKIKSVCWICLV